MSEGLPPGSPLDDEAEQERKVPEQARDERVVATELVVAVPVFFFRAVSD